VTAGFRGAADVITFLIAFLIATAPLWIAALIVFFIVRAVLRRRRVKRAAATAPAVQVPPNDQTDV
jgi:large-conductance mechanosensitive channel